MANLTSTTVTGTLNTTSTITGPGSGVSAINASNVSSGTLASDRLPTVPTTKGGTGLTSIGSAGQVLKVATPGSALEFGDAGGGGDYVQRIYTSPATWTYNADVKALKVSVWGGGGNGGNGNRTPNPGGQNILGGFGGTGGYAEEYIDSASLSTPVSVTVGGTSGTSSFGAFLSATGGAAGQNAPVITTGNPGVPGTGSGGDLNLPGNAGVAYGIGMPGPGKPTYYQPSPGDGVGYAAGGSSRANQPGLPGTPGIVIIEEYY